MTSEMDGGAERGPRIRTPDRRVRVFVSSTLSELPAERAAARTAITRLHLTPVMFELGARPHAPRELYRAYLAQSEIFVGIYWQVVGTTIWPGMQSTTDDRAAAAASALGPAEFAAATAVGARMRLPDALRYGLAATAEPATSEPLPD
jgi:uncharacterized protein DUF4062